MDAMNPGHTIQLGRQYKKAYSRARKFGKQHKLFKKNALKKINDRTIPAELDTIESRSRPQQPGESMARVAARSLVSWETGDDTEGDLENLYGLQLDPARVDHSLQLRDDLAAADNAWRVHDMHWGLTTRQTLKPVVDSWVKSHYSYR